MQAITLLVEADEAGVRVQLVPSGLPPAVVLSALRVAEGQALAQVIEAEVERRLSEDVEDAEGEASDKDGE